MALAATGALGVTVMSEPLRPRTASGAFDAERVGGDSDAAHAAAVWSVTAVTVAAAAGAAWVAWRVARHSTAQTPASVRRIFRAACALATASAVAQVAVLLWPAPVTLLCACAAIVGALGALFPVAALRAPVASDWARAVCYAGFLASCIVVALAFLARPCGSRWQPIPSD